MISEEEKKAIEMIKEQKENVEYSINAMECTPEDYDEDVYDDCVEWNKNAETILNLIETQNKMIELMAEYIEEAEIMHKAKFPFDMQKPDGLSLVQVASKQEIEEYFRNKAKESE